MKRLILLMALCFLIPLTAFATPAQEKAFVDSYKAAFEGKDAAKLESFLYTKGADPMALEFYKMMMTAEMGSKISKIELRPLTPAETLKALETMPSPSGGMSKLPVKPTLKLIVSVQSADANGSSTSSSESFVAEVDGGLFIPVPAPVKK